jgi:hypothetical protein
MTHERRRLQRTAQISSLSVHIALFLQQDLNDFGLRFGSTLSASSQEFSKPLPALEYSQLNHPTSSPRYLACSDRHAELGTRGVIEVDRITIYLDSLCFFSRILQVFVDIKIFTAQFPHEFTTIYGLLTRPVERHGNRSDYDSAQLSLLLLKDLYSFIYTRCS